MTKLKKYSIGDEVQAKDGLLKLLADTGERNKSTGNIIGLWQCYCGKEFKTMNRNITKSNTQSCGCLQQKVRDEKIRKGEEAALTRHPQYLYSLHGTICRKCYDDKCESYKDYGGRGITVFKDWVNDEEKFITDLLNAIGPKPELHANYQLDRINNNGNYELPNLRWASCKDNCNNRRNSVLISIPIDGKEEIKTVAKWSDYSGLKYGLIRDRYNAGWRGAELLQPAQSYKFSAGIENLWNNVAGRCADVNNTRYGGRGIKLWEPWANDREKFDKEIIELIGQKPGPGYNLDRILNDGDYIPGNIKWSTYAENNRNTSHNHLLTIEGVTKTLSEWSAQSGVSSDTIKRRVKQGWPGYKWLIPTNYRNGGAKLSDEIIKLINEKYSEGLSFNKISDLLDIRKSKVSQVINKLGKYAEIKKEEIL